jgi:chitinase
VYMTYDLHGQWDYGNPYSVSGCPTGDCLRSHVNYTETILSLSMITKTGVPGPKIVAGVASYGRSFGMVDPNCPGPNCHFTGPGSGARKGMCTQTAGYIANAEIRRWIDHGQYGNYNMETYWDEPSRSIITYSSDGTWVAYMNETERDYRFAQYIVNYWLSGTSLWAMDLTEFVPQLPDGNRLAPFEYTECSETFDSLDALSAAADIPDICMNVYLMQALSGNLTSSLNKYNDILENDYDEKFGYYVNAVKAASPHALDC